MTYTPPSFALTGKVAAVTGGNAGIGRAIALALGSAGAAVAILARNAERNAATVAELSALGVNAIGVALDVTIRESLDQAIADVQAQLGGIDILVNNAGNADISGGILNQSEAGWDKTIATHLDATFLLSQAAACAMIARGGGKIVNLGSMYSIFGAAALPAYGAVKGAIVQLTKAMAVELAPHNIQVNAIAPGWIATEMTAVARDDPDWKDFNTQLMTRTPAARWGQPDECAGAVVFLASPAADFVTGVLLPIDGGYSIA